jgi:hypothetical protein
MESRTEVVTAPSIPIAASKEEKRKAEGRANAFGIHPPPNRLSRILVAINRSKTPVL